jgi:hypothetical protein
VVVLVKGPGKVGRLQEFCGNEPLLLVVLIVEAKLD